VTGGRIWVENRVDFTNPKNLLTAGFALMAAAGGMSLKLGALSLGSIGTATFGAIILYQILDATHGKDTLYAPRDPASPQHVESSN